MADTELKLSEMTDEHLKAVHKSVSNEMRDRAERAREKQHTENSRVLKELAKHSDLILPLMEHERSSCSDENPCNGIDHDTHLYRCAKCALIHLLADASWTSRCEYEVVFKVEIHHS